MLAINSTAPLYFDAPTQPELSAWDMDISEYMHTDALQKRQAEAVQHETDTFAGICKGDLVRIETTNRNMPFIGRVVKLVYGGWVVAEQPGNIRYKAGVDSVRVLRKAEAVHA